MLNRRQAALTQVSLGQLMLRLWAGFYKLIARAGQEFRQQRSKGSRMQDGFCLFEPQLAAAIAFLLGVSHFQTQTRLENT
jgi:hypothetical protein